MDSYALLPIDGCELNERCDRLFRLKSAMLFLHQLWIHKENLKKHYLEEAFEFCQCFHAITAMRRKTMTKCDTKTDMIKQHPSVASSIRRMVTQCKGRARFHIDGGTTAQAITRFEGAMPASTSEICIVAFRKRQHRAFDRMTFRLGMRYFDFTFNRPFAIFRT